ncbi:hypothetical protein D3C71_676680 [compost metagenome]
MRIKRHQAAHQVFQFAHVARPGIGLHHVQRLAVETLAVKPFLFRHLHEVPDEIGNIFRAVAQRRQAQRHDIEAIIKIFAEQALIDQVLQILVGGSNDAHVGADRRAPADRRIFALLQHAQKAGLCIHRHVADFVEEQRATLGLFETTGRAVLRTGKGALLVTEQF